MDQNNHLSSVFFDCLGEFTTVCQLSTGDYEDEDSFRVHQLFTRDDDQTIEFRTICEKQVWAKRCEWQFLDKHLDYKKPFIVQYFHGIEKTGKSDGYEMHLIAQRT